MIDIDERLIEAQFFDSLRVCGIEPRDDLSLIMDGQTHRFSVAGDRGAATSGAYYIHADGCPNWGIQDFHKTGDMQKFTFDFKQAGISQERERALKATFNSPEYQARKQQEKERQKESERVAVLSAWREYLTGSDIAMSDHPYIKAKHAFLGHGHGVRSVVDKKFIVHGNLFVPLIDAMTGQFRSIQRISATLNHEGKFTKGFFSGVSVKGLVCELIPYLVGGVFSIKLNESARREELDTDTLFICEGFATGLAVYEIADFQAPVICSMSANNICNVAAVYRKRYPRMKIFIAADNDTAGLKAAHEAVTLGYANDISIPPIEGGDWNDWLTGQKGLN